MSRSATRALVVSTLEATGSYTQIYGAPPDRFGGLSPIAVVRSGGMVDIEQARSLYTLEQTIVATIYVRRESSDPETAEDALDDLVEEAVIALREAGFLSITTESAPDGAPLRIVDGKDYRVERIVMRWEQEEDG